MKCKDIQNALNDENSDLKTVAKHLKNCPACAAEYGDELALEMSLRDLALEMESIDIAKDLSSKLYTINRNIRHLNFLQKWVWITAGAITLVIMAASMPAVLEWLNTAFTYAISIIPPKELSYSVDLNRLADNVKSSKYFIYIFISISILVTSIAVHLWREFKEIVK